MKCSDQIRFVASLAWRIGVERERFICRNNKIVPESYLVLDKLSSLSCFGPELSACQLEDRVGPVEISELAKALNDNDEKISQAAMHVGLSANFIEVAPYDMPLNVFPDANGRYAQIACRLGQRRLSAACRVAGTHIHVGMPNPDTALAVYNRVRKKCAEQLIMGDHSNGGRIYLYRQVAPDPFPRKYASWDEYNNVGTSLGWSSPRDCWDFIRLSVHGTIEFRTFGVTDDNSEIEEWAHYCLDLCKSSC